MGGTIVLPPRLRAALEVDVRWRTQRAAVVEPLAHIIKRDRRGQFRLRCWNSLWKLRRLPCMAP
jgi:hypothetical protein